MIKVIKMCNLFGFWRVMRDPEYYHKKYGVEPDMAVFGKALGNGYAISAVIGKREVMEATQNTFISSTFWSERIGYVAALKTLEIFESTQHWKLLCKNA